MPSQKNLSTNYSSSPSKQSSPPPPAQASNASPISPPKRNLLQVSDNHHFSGPNSHAFTNSSNSRRGHGMGVTIGLTAGALIFIVLMIVLCCICFKKRYVKRKNYYSAMINTGDDSNNSPNLAFPATMRAYKYEELAAATDGFSEANLIGEGGFGKVHKGVLPDGKVVAVKCLGDGRHQGEKEFRAEVEIIGHLHHRNLASLIGYCTSQAHRILVYKFVSNGTLEHHLHVNDGVILDWSKRLKIAIGTAKALAYLHENCQPRIIHRDIKAANILLDDNFEPMVTDFGLAKLLGDNLKHLTTRVMGTVGYVAPEYQTSGKITEKVDVFSYGVVLLELITGRRPINPDEAEENLANWARHPLKMAQENDDMYVSIVDQKLGNDYNKTEMARVMACAAASIRVPSNSRPRMSEIARALEGQITDLDYTLIEHVMKN